MTMTLAQWAAIGLAVTMVPALLFWAGRARTAANECAERLRREARERRAQEIARENEERAKKDAEQRAEAERQKQKRLQELDAIIASLEKRRAAVRASHDKDLADAAADEAAEVERARKRGLAERAKIEVARDGALAPIIRELGSYQMERAVLARSDGCQMAATNALYAGLSSQAQSQNALMNGSGLRRLPPHAGHAVFPFPWAF